MDSLQKSRLRALAEAAEGEAILPFIPVPPIRRFDVCKALVGLFPMALLCAAIFPFYPGTTKYAMGVLKSSVHTCFFCYELRRASLEEEISFFERRSGSNHTLMQLLALRREYRSSFTFVLPNSAAASLADVHRQQVSAPSPHPAPIASASWALPLTGVGRLHIP